MNFSIFYEKMDRFKTIRDLTYHIANVGVDLNKENKNREDTDIARFSYNDAKYIRREMQLNNEDLYMMYVYLNVYSDSIEELSYMIFPQNEIVVLSTSLKPLICGVCVCMCVYDSIHVCTSPA